MLVMIEIGTSGALLWRFRRDISSSRWLYSLVSDLVTPFLLPFLTWNERVVLSVLVVWIPGKNEMSESQESLILFSSNDVIIGLLR